MTSNFLDEEKLHKNGGLIVETTYKAMTGELIFLTWRTRPDISTSVRTLPQFSNQPTMFLMNCVKLVFGRLKETTNFKIELESKADCTGFVFYANSDFAGDKSDRKSRSGWAGYIDSMMFPWNTGKQVCVSLFTAGAEYIVLAKCSSDIKWIVNYIVELGILKVFFSSYCLIIQLQTFGPKEKWARKKQNSSRSGIPMYNIWSAQMMLTWSTFTRRITTQICFWIHWIKFYPKTMRSSWYCRKWNSSSREVLKTRYCRTYLDETKNELKWIMWHSFLATLWNGISSDVEFCKNLLTQIS